MTRYEIVCADVIDWATSYNGPKFHAMLCDPPYHLYTQDRRGIRFTERLHRDTKGAEYEATLKRSGFMGKRWDGGDIAFQSSTWAALAEHLHPGAFIMAFGGARTYHRLAVALEDAGLRIHPAFGWLQGQGFPKATRIDTQIDRTAGKFEVRETVERPIAYPDSDCWGIPNKNVGPRGSDVCYGKYEDRPSGGMRVDTLAATPLARVWEGHRYGLQCIKPALEFIALAQKPYEGKPVDCITRTGAGALWVDGGKIAAGKDYDEAGWGPRFGETSMPNMGGHQTRPWVQDAIEKGEPVKDSQPSVQGRWPSNFVLSHVPPDADGNGGCVRVGTRRVKGTNQSNDKRAKLNMGYGGYEPGNDGRASPDNLETVDAWRCEPSCPIRKIGEQSGESGPTGRKARKHSVKTGMFGVGDKTHNDYYDKGTAARFFKNCDWSYEVAERLAESDPVKYASKVAFREREAGLFGSIACVKCGGMDSEVHIDDNGKEAKCRRCNHPTLKPLSLLIWLCKLLAPPPEYAPRRLLVPFSGSGSEMCATVISGCWEEIVGIELESDYVDINRARLRFWQGWSERSGETDPKTILGLARKEERREKQTDQLAMELVRER